MWENRSRLIFMSSMLLSGALFVQMGLYLLHMVSGWDVKYNVLELCHSVIGRLGFQWMGYALNVLVLHAFLYSVWYCVRQLVLAERFYRRLLRNRDDALADELNGAYAHGKAYITVVRSSAPMAFAMGLVRPRIVISTGLIDMLDEQELQAVIYHERFHQMHGDPLKTFLLSLAASVMWYLPILKSSQHNYKIIREVLADKYAIGKQGASVYLGGALLKLLQSKTAAAVPMAHVSFADTSVNYRIRHILEPGSDIPLKWPFTPAVVSVQTLLLICAMFMVVLH